MKIIWNTIGTTFNSFISLFLLVVVTRLNGIETAGVFSLAFTFSLLMQTISNYGGRIYQVSDTVEEFSFSEYFSSRLKTSLITILITIIYAYFMKQSNIGILFSLVIIKIIESFSDVIYGEFQKNDKLDYIGKSLFYKSIISAIVFTIIDILTKNIFYSIMGMVLTTMIIFVFYDLKLLKNYNKIKIIFNNKVFKKSKYVFILSFVTLLIINAPRFIGEKGLSSEEFGYLGILMMIPTVMALFGQFVAQPIVINLSLYYKKKDEPNFSKLIKKSNLIIIILGLLTCIVAVTIGPSVLKILYGISFEKYRFIFCVLIVAGTLNSITAILSNALTILRETKIQFYMYILVLFIEIVVLTNFYNNDLTRLIWCFVSSMIIQIILFYTIFITCKRKKIKEEKNIWKLYF